MREAHRGGPPRGDAGGAPLHLLRLEALKPGTPATARHLAGRFAGSLRPGGPRAIDAAWVAGILTPAELAIWRRLSGPDRRHAVDVARRADAELGNADRAALAAALLHDVGKLDSGLGTLARVPATLVGLAGFRRAVVPGNGRSSGLCRRIAMYLDHPARGAARLRAAGSDPLTVAWAAEHHLPEDRWSVPPAVGRVLHAADDD